MELFDIDSCMKKVPEKGHGDIQSLYLTNGWISEQNPLQFSWQLLNL